MKTLIFIAVAFLVIALAGLISSKLKLDTPKSNASKAERKWDNDVAKYKNLIGKLPRVQRDEIHRRSGRTKRRATRKRMRPSVRSVPAWRSALTSSPARRRF